MSLSDVVQNILNQEYDPVRVDYGSKLDAYAIVNVHDNQSQYGSRRLVQSEHNVQSFRQIFLFPATTSETAEKDLLRISAVDDARRIQWTWPLKEGETVMDPETGLTKSYLQDHNPTKLINNTISHIRLWDLCIQQDRPIAILNHNITFNFNFSWEHDVISRGFVNGVVGLNARNVETRNNDYFISRMQDLPKGTIHKTPSLEFADLGINNPQPFMGHGAYVITPWAAKEGFKLIERVGLWPIQFLLCRQLAPWTYITWPQKADAKGSISPTWVPPK